MTLHDDMCRCQGQATDGRICPRRETCIRYLQIAKDKAGWFSYCSFLCDEDWRSWLPEKVRT